MNKLLICLLIFAVATSCSKKVAPEIEENISFELNTGAVIVSSGSSQAFKVTMKSKIPKAGIKIDISAAEEATGTPVVPQTSTVSSSTSITDCLVQNLPRQTWVVATVKVTSSSTLTNTASQTFRVVFK